jgi:predicted PurR-regulated permease PerM
MQQNAERSENFKRQIYFWLFAFVAFAIFLVVFSSILLPFVVGMALAYFLDPVADWLERRGLSRLMASMVILIGFVLIFVLLLVLLIPVIVGQASEFIARIPEYVSKLQELIAGADTNLLPSWVQEQIASVKENFSRLLAEGAGFAGTLLTQIWNSGKSLIDVISLLVVAPVVAFYLLLDWDRMVDKVDSWVPRQHVASVRQIARDMDRSIAGFIRGQGSLCMILGVYYAVGLSLVGLNFGLLIGLFAGAISFIPYIGSTIGLVLALGVALVQFWPEYWSIILTLVVFATGQFIEGNILQPKLVGSSVGLHPVWLMFALFAFGLLFGFVGLLVAVPAAAAVGVLVRFALTRYLESDLYHGRPVSPVILQEDALRQSDKNTFQG